MLKGEVKQNLGDRKDYGCKCGKKYKSYAAVYTHIRNKHDRDKAYMSEIERPVWNRAPKGRPKDKSKRFLNFEIEQINVLENGLLDLTEKIKHYSEMQILLKGDEELDFQKVEEQAQKKYLNKEVFKVAEESGNRYEGFRDLQALTKQFLRQFCKHLSEEISAKILTSFLYLQKEIPEEAINLGFEQIWPNAPGIESLLLQIFKNWNQVNEKAIKLEAEYPGNDLSQSLKENNIKKEL